MNQLVHVHLDYIDSDAKSFDIDEDILENIRLKFNKDRHPQVLYDITEVSSNRNPITPENTPLIRGRHYLWADGREKWEDRQLVQNALFCSNAAYQYKPIHYLNAKKVYHSIERLIAANVKYGDQVLCIFLGSEHRRQKEKTLIVAFRGTTTKKDIETDSKIGLKAHQSFVGKVHSGFLERMEKVPVGEIIDLAISHKAHQILTCGHSLGGAVSSLVHVELITYLHRKANLVISPKNVLNITFGAPMLGNHEFAEFVSKRNYAENMFHFASAWDIVPSMLSIGHGIESVKQSSIVRSVIGHFPTVCYQIGLKCLTLDKKSNAEEIEAAKKVIKSRCSTLQNDFDKSNYVPVGKFLLIHGLQKNPNIEYISKHSKVIERVIQAPMDYASTLPYKELSKIQNWHSIEKYMELVKTFYSGFEYPSSEFADFQQREIFIEKTKNNFLDENGLKYKFESACSFTCGYDQCEELKRVALYLEDQPVAFCQACRYDPFKTEHFYHKDCFRKEHVNDKKTHKIQIIDWQKYTSKKNEWEKLFKDPDVTEKNVLKIFQSKITAFIMLMISPAMHSYDYYEQNFNNLDIPIDPFGGAEKIIEATQGMYGEKGLVVILTNSFGISEMIEKIVECIGANQITEHLSISLGMKNITESCVDLMEFYGIEFFVHKLLSELPNTDLLIKLTDKIGANQIATRIVSSIGNEKLMTAMQTQFGRFEVAKCLTVPSLQFSATASTTGAIAGFGIFSLCDCYRWSTRKISLEQFKTATLENFVLCLLFALISWSMASVGTFLGASIGHPAFIGIFQIAGAIIGGLFAFKTVELLSDNMKWALNSEDEQKSDVIVDTLHFLEVPLPNGDFKKILEDDVMKCFRRNKLRFHPEKNKENELASLNYFSRDTLLSYIREPISLSNAVIERVNKKLIKKREGIDIHRMKKGITKLKELRPHQN